MQCSHLIIHGFNTTALHAPTPTMKVDNEINVTEKSDVHDIIQCQVT
jgi:hypothetical protein